MTEHRRPEELLEFPCSYEFKAFGAAADEGFAETVRLAVSRVIPVGADALRTRLSSARNYQCVSVLVRLETAAQLTEIYAILRGVEGLRYLL